MVMSYWILDIHVSYTRRLQLKRGTTFMCFRYLVCTHHVRVRSRSFVTRVGMLMYTAQKILARFSMLHEYTTSSSQQQDL